MFYLYMDNLINIDNMSQVDNPVSILNQEMSKQFLHSKSESDKYKVMHGYIYAYPCVHRRRNLSVCSMHCVKFFMKATLLEQMKRDYIHIKHTKAMTREQVERQEEVRLH